jgi:hypothetical protein
MAGIGLGIAACGFCLGVGISRLGLGISRSGEHIATGLGAGIENGLKGHGSQTIAQVHGYFGAHEVMNERLQKLLPRVRGENVGTRLKHFQDV